MSTKVQLNEETQIKSRRLSENHEHKHQQRPLANKSLNMFFVRHAAYPRHLKFISGD
jgi:hypothetical protein